MDILTLVGLIIGAISFCFAIYQYYDFKKYPKEITYFDYGATQIYNSLVRNFSNIKIIYNNETEIQKELLYIKGCFICSGHRDIENSNNNNIDLEFKNNITILNSSIINKSDNVESTIVNSLNHIHISFKNLKRNEIIEYEAIAKINNHNTNESAYSNIIKFKHRISDTKEIKYFKKIDFSKFAIKLYVIMAFSIIVLSALGYTTYIKQMSYDYNNNKNIESVYCITNILNENIKLYDIKNNVLIKTISVKELNNLKPKGLFIKKATGLFILGALIFILFTNYIIIILFLKIRKNLRIEKRILGYEPKNYLNKLFLG